MARTHNVIDLARFEHIIRDDLNLEVPRVLCVLRPLEVIIDNYPDDQVEQLEGSYYPRDVPKEGSRKLPFSKKLYVERDDFAEQPPAGWFRLALGAEVRLRYAYIIRCERVVKDDAGNVIRLHCSVDPDSRGGKPKDGRKVKGTIHWVSAQHAVPVQVRLYDRLFTSENPDAEDGDFVDYLNPQSLEVLEGAQLEPAAAGSDFRWYQFERQGYFAIDPESKPDALVFNRVVTLRDTWGKRQEQAKPQSKKTSEAKSVSSTAAKAPAEEQRRELNAEERAQRDRITKLGVPEHDAEFIVLQEGLLSFFDHALAIHNQPRTVAKWIVNELQRELKSTPLTDLPFGGNRAW